ncbi:MAG: alpha-glucosidase, partial [Fimbriimonadaceae bacterium]|nr:alpha-glucosidase [Fimbriimonadaceae bacterium]
MLFRVESKPREPYVGEVIGNIRVQILSPTLVRIELKGPRGFEDRNTFTVQKRPRPIAPEKTEVDGHLHRIFYGSIEVAVNGGQSIADVIVYRDGKLAFKGTAKPQQLAFFPSPGHIPKSLPVYDAPRIIPSKWGAVPAKSKVKGETSGWDLSNQSTDVYVFLPDNYSQFRKEFLSLTGPTELPPLYSFGFWHSRYHPYSDKEALDVIDTYRKKDIPLDVFVVDTDWRVGASHGYATNAKLFPDMPGFIAKAHAKNVRLMYNDHPEPVGKTALEPKELAYRYEGLSSLLNMGVDVWWYDRNWSTHLHEPAPGLPKEVWGAAMFHDITQTARPNQRPLIMSNVPGIDNGLRNSVPHAAAHRYPVWWTGDTTGSFQYLENGIVNAVNSGADTFIPYLSEDLGGHFGNPLREVYSRFVQYGSLSPLARLHCTAGETRDPWAFGEPAESIVRDYVKLRYRLLPTFYAAARENYENGTPLLRRCDLDWPGMDGASAADQYLLGDDILVAPIFTSVDPEPTAIPVELLHNSSGGTGLKGEYFPNVDLKGAPQLVRMDPQIDFNWKVGPPAPGMPDENFSIRWTGKVGPVPVSGSYEFVTVTDDGVRLWVDGKMIIDKFQNMDHWQNRGSIDLE